MIRVILAQDIGTVIIEAMGEADNPKTRFAVFGSLFFSTVYCGYSVMTGNIGSIIVWQALVESGIPANWSNWAARMLPILFFVGGAFLFLELEFWVVRDPGAIQYFRNKSEQQRRSQIKYHPLSVTTETAQDSGVFVFQEGERKPDVIPELFQMKPLPPFTWKDINISVIVLITVLLWATEAATNLDTTYVGILSILALHFPYIGPCYIGDRNANIKLLIFIICVIGLGNVFQDPSLADLSLVLDGWISSILSLSSHQFAQYYLGFCFSTVAIWVLSSTPAAGILVPQLVKVAYQLGLDPYKLSLTIPLGCCALIFPSNTPPMLVSFQLNKFPKIDFFKIIVTNAVFVFAVLAPLELLYIQHFEPLPPAPPVPPTL